MLFAIGVLQQCDACGAVRVVLNRIDRCNDTVFDTTEVDDAVFLFVSATTVTRSDFALVVPSAGFGLWTQQGTFWLVARRQFLEVANRRVASAGAGRLVDSDAHEYRFFLRAVSVRGSVALRLVSDLWRTKRSSQCPRRSRCDGLREARRLLSSSRWFVQSCI